jgi:NAD(P)-dependent dehydrogenase (short-subunit alcohol dehydrogenase family)
VDQFEQIIATNLTGVCFAIQAALPVLRTGAAVVLIGSGSCLDRNAATYAATKGGALDRTRDGGRTVA